MDLYEIRTRLNEGKSIFDLSMRVTYYARVSTDKDEQLHSLAAQVGYYSDFIRECPNWSFVEGYVDEGISGTSVKKRDSFLRMMEDAKASRFDFVVTKEISRFSRNTLDSIRYTQELLQHGVGVFFQSDNINTLMPDAELRLTIMSSIAQDEVRKISERVKFGFKRAIEHGVVLGNSKIWGYEKQNGTLVVNEREAELVRLIFELYANRNMGIRAISGYLTGEGYRNSKGNPFSFSTIKGILINPKYKGFYCGGKTHKYDYKLSRRKYLAEEQWVMYRDEDNVPPLVSDELWEKANAILSKRSAALSAENRSGYQNKYSYSGKIICGEHHVPYYRALYQYPSGKKEVWQCQEYMRKGKAGCCSPVLYTSELDEVLRQALEQFSVQKGELVRELMEVYRAAGNEFRHSEDAAACRIEIDAVMRRKDKLLDLSIEGCISDHEFALRNQRFNEDMEELRSRLSGFEAQELKQRELMQSMDVLRQAITRELDFADGFSAGVVDAFVDRIEVLHSGIKQQIRLRVSFKALREPRDYILRRKRGQASVCCEQYIC